MEECPNCGHLGPHSPEALRRHHRVYSQACKSAAIFARGERASWEAEWRFQMSQDVDYSKGKPSAETMRCKGAMDALSQFATHMEQKAREALERADAIKETA